MQEANKGNLTKGDTGIWSGGNTTAGWSGLDTTGGWSGADSTLDETMLHPVTGTAEFPPLSQQPISPGQTMPADNPADHFVLEKQTPVPPGQEEFKVQKNMDDLIPESEKMMRSQLHQAKHTHAISAELKLLLENENKILNQVMKRCEKFTKLKGENKRSTEEWNRDSKKRLPQFENHLIKLTNYPDDKIMDVEGVTARVQQKVLLEIVSKTMLAVNNMSVQLSMENTIINDIESSLSDLKHQSAAMVRQISSWLKMLTTLDRNQSAVVERWRQLKQRLKQLREKAKKMEESDVAGESGTKLMSIVRGYEDRIASLEEAFRQLTKVYSSACEDPRDQLTEEYGSACPSSREQACRQRAEVCNNPCASPCEPRVRTPYS